MMKRPVAGLACSHINASCCTNFAPERIVSKLEVAKAGQAAWCTWLIALHCISSHPPPADSRSRLVTWQLCTETLSAHYFISCHPQYLAHSDAPRGSMGLEHYNTDWAPCIDRAGPERVAEGLSVACAAIVNNADRCNHWCWSSRMTLVFTLALPNQLLLTPKLLLLLLRRDFQVPDAHIAGFETFSNTP